jgi:hypothetical protein
MPRPLKVIGMMVAAMPDEHKALGLRSHNQQVRAVAAVRSMAEFGRLTGVSYNHLKDYAAETWNARDIERALAHPGKLVLSATVPSEVEHKDAPAYIVREPGGAA